MNIFLIALAALAPALVSAAQVDTSKLSNGAPIDIVEDASSPRQSLILVFHGGAGLVPKEQQGITSILQDMLSEGPRGMSGDDYRKKLFLLNASIGFSGTARATYVSITAPVDSLKPVLQLAYEVLQKPKLDAATFDLAKAKVLTSAQSIFDNMRGATYYFAFRDAFQFHPETMDGSAVPKTVEALTLERAKEWLPKLVDFRKMSVATVGPASKWVVTADLQTIMAQTKKALKNNSFIPTKAESLDPAKFLPTELKVAVLNKPKATDNQILYIFPEALSFDNKERLVALVTHENLGGGLTGKLGDTLRTQRGLTYSASTRADGQKPYWLLYTFGGIFQTEGLLAGVPEVIEKFKTDKLDPKDIELAKSMNQTAFRSGMELPEDRLFARLRLKMYDRDPTFIDKFEDYLKSVTVEEVDAFRKARLNYKQGFLYLMGDKDQILPALEKVGIKKDKVKVVELGDLT